MRVQFQTILCATDLSDNANHAVTHGIALAREFQARLLICHVIDLPTPAMYGEAYLAPEEHLNRNLEYARENLTELMAGQQVKWEPIITVGPAADEISRIAREQDADMTVTATRGRKGLKRLLLGSVTERLMRTLPCPLLVVRAAEPLAQLPQEGGLQVRRILVGCDFSPDADLAFVHALSMAQEFQAELHLVHVIEMPVYTDILKPVLEHRRESSEAVKDFLQEKLRHLVPEEARHWCRPKTALLEGQPYDQLLQYAGAQAIDLIVLGVRGHGLIGTMIVGSTTDRVIRQANCPVLSVCPQDRSTS
jgi:nucleotide-binding universal stress UspA family protein